MTFPEIDPMHDSFEQNLRSGNTRYFLAQVCGLKSLGSWQKYWQLHLFGVEDRVQSRSSKITLKSNFDSNQKIIGLNVLRI